MNLDNETSGWLTITGGVPKVPILGPLIFTIYVYDIDIVLSNTKFHSYADNLSALRDQSNIHTQVSNLNKTVARISDDIIRLSLWSRENGLKLNSEKPQPKLIAYSHALTTI